MKLEDAMKQDFGKMTPQQRSHLRKRLLAAGMPIPPALDLKKGAAPISGKNAPDADGPSKCTVVGADGTEHVYSVGEDNGK